MRYFRSAFLTAIVALMLVVPATAGAQITSISVSPVGQLQARGAAVDLQVGVQCEPGWNVTSVGAQMTQVTSGHKVTTGFGSLSLSFPGVPCPLSPGTLTVIASSSAFKTGSAIAGVGVDVFNPATDQFASRSVTQTVSVTKK